MPRVYHYCPSITRRDAIGYSLTYLHRAMLRAGIPSFLVCDDDVLPAAPPFTMPFKDLVALAPTSDDVLLFHYSFVDRNAEQLLSLACRKVMIYHNITPGHFFRSVGQTWLADRCDEGRAFLSRMSGSFDIVVGDSAYNAAELAEHKFPKPVVIPVFYNDRFFRDLSSENDAFLRRRTAGELSLVFIGRFVPNKRPDNLMRIVSVLKDVARRPTRLRLHGKVWDRGYHASLRQIAEQLDVDNHISFEIDQPPAALRTSLASADAFISVSEHEGFMVPLVEAFSAGCPVIALASSAVTETCGSAAIMVREPDLEAIAGHVIALRRDPDLRAELLRLQSRRAEDFSARLTLQRWNVVLRDLLHRPLVSDAHRV